MVNSFYCDEVSLSGFFDAELIRRLRLLRTGNAPTTQQRQDLEFEMTAIRDPREVLASLGLPPTTKDDEVSDASVSTETQPLTVSCVGARPLLSFLIEACRRTFVPPNAFVSSCLEARALYDAHYLRLCGGDAVLGMSRLLLPQMVLLSRSRIEMGNDDTDVIVTWLPRIAIAKTLHDQRLKEAELFQHLTGSAFRFAVSLWSSDDAVCLDHGDFFFDLSALLSGVTLFPPRGGHCKLSFKK